MDKFVVRGGNPLLGTIKISGAKNSALPLHGRRHPHRRRDHSRKHPPGPRHRDRAPPAHLHGRRGRTRLRPRPAPHPHQVRHPLRPRCQVRDRQDHARQLARARPAHRAHRHRPRGHARRLRHRRPSHRPAHQGPRGHGRHHHPGPRLPRSPHPQQRNSSVSRARTWSSTRSPSRAPKTC
jgi:hypothetical protein